MSCVTIKGYNYKVIGKNTKKAQHYMKAYMADYGSIYEAYGRPSSAKVSAWEEICRRLSLVRITGAGTFQFSCAGLLKDDDGRKHFVIETPGYSFIVLDGWDYMYAGGAL